MTGELIIQAQHRLFMGNWACWAERWGQCGQFPGGLPGLRTHLPGRATFVPGLNQCFPHCCLIHSAPFSFSKGQIRRPQSALEGLAGWRGPISWISPSSHTSWCQTHFISSRLGTGGASPPGLLPPLVCFPAGDSRSPTAGGRLLCLGP